MLRNAINLSFTFLLVIAIGYSSNPSWACGNSIAIMSGQTNYPPLSWRNENHLDGGLVQLAKKLFRGINITADSDDGGPWKRIQLRAQRGEIDFLLGIRRTKEREQYLDFIEPPVTPAVQSVFVHKDRDFEFEVWDDLKGKTGNITSGSSFGKAFNEYQQNNLDIEYSETVEQIFKKLVLNRVDYMLGPLSTTILYLEKENLSNEIIRKPTPLTVIDEYFAIPKNSPCSIHVNYMSTRLQEIINSGEMDIIMEESFLLWFTQKGISDVLMY